MRNRALRSLFAIATIWTAACLAPIGDDGYVDESDFPQGSAFKHAGGERLVVPDLTDAFEFTRVWRIGNRDNITRIYLLVHGDGNTDYSGSTEGDRNDMEERLPPGEGAIVAYPVSPSGNWPAFDGGRNGRKVLRLFEELRTLAGRTDVVFEQFALSGGGRVNHALMRLINEHGDEADVRAFAADNLRGIHDGDSLSYSLNSMRDNYILSIEDYPHVRFAFIHNTSGKMSYVHSYHNAIAKRFNDGRGYPFGGSLSLQDGRLRFWSAATHWTAWKGQFAKVFFGEQGPVHPDGDAWIGAPCGVARDCSADICFVESDGYPGGMCSKRCDGSCPDRGGEPITGCVTLDGEGWCLSRADTSAYPGSGCRPGYHAQSLLRHGSRSTWRTMCIPDDERTVFSFAGTGTPARIPDAPLAGIRSTATASSVPDCALEVSVDVTIRHTYRGDLVVGLTDPSGRRAVLQSRQGAEARDLVLQGVTADLGASGANGAWVLDVADEERKDEGSLESWKVELRCAR
ncbi:MAG: proprotein convertase P-domain-containing protein [Deltaproteobacteria bacterium]|nr:proprotein convertase P-domain-containing protein [Deltaproteobacteria bacterium]